MSHSVGEQTTRRPRVAFVYARDDAVLGGGADARAGALREALGRVAAVDDLLLTATSRKRPRLRRVTEGLRGAAHGVPPRLSQQLDSRERKSILPRLLAADVIVASTTFSLPYVPRSLWARTVLDAHNIESRITSQLAKHDPQCWRRAAFRGTASWTRLWETAAARRLAQVWAV